ncbi:MAG: hypothetical protein SGI72_01715 [Planctomycetota bacterium]|nr:hypothetical protein [Planctomycetota bacterium]
MQFAVVSAFLADIITPTPIQETSRSPVLYLIIAAIAVILLVLYRRRTNKPPE